MAHGHAARVPALPADCSGHPPPTAGCCHVAWAAARKAAKVRINSACVAGRQLQSISDRPLCDSQPGPHHRVSVAATGAHIRGSVVHVSPGCPRTRGRSGIASSHGADRACSGSWQPRSPRRPSGANPHLERRRRAYQRRFEAASPGEAAASQRDRGRTFDVGRRDRWPWRCESSWRSETDGWAPIPVGALDAPGRCRLRPVVARWGGLGHDRRRTTGRRWVKLPGLGVALVGCDLADRRRERMPRGIPPSVHCLLRGR